MIKRNILKLSLTYLALLVIFTSLIICINFIPKSAIKENLIKSSIFLHNEGIYKNYTNNINFRLDNFTDALMLNIVATVNEEKPIDAAMKSYYLYADPISERATLIEKAANDDDTIWQCPYGRYWHGYQILLRPLLVVFDYAQIRILNYTLFAFLISICFMQICRKISKGVAVIFLSSLLVINFPIIPMSMQFSNCFYMLLIATIAVLKFPVLTKNRTNLLCTFFAIGAATSYFDLLTTPVLTLGFPMIAYLLANEKKNKLKEVVIISIIWGVGYGLMWASKWGICYAITGDSILDNALGSVKLRSSQSLNGGNITTMKVIKTFGIHLIPYFLILPIISFIKNRSTVELKKYGYLLLIAMIPPIWYFVLKNHSICHTWFTWRAMLLSIFSLILFIYYTVDFKNLFKKSNQPK